MPRELFRRLFVAFVIIFAAPLLVRATTCQAQVVADRPACRSCRVVTSSVLTFQTDGVVQKPRYGPTLMRYPVLMGEPLNVAEDRKGRYWVLTPGSLPQVYSARGHLISEVGRNGEGPGEFRSADKVILLPGDSAMIVDGTLRRGTVFGPDLRMVRTIPLGSAVGSMAVLSWPSRVVVNAATPSPELAGWALHLFDFTGEAPARRTSFGDTGGELRPGHAGSLVREFFDVRPGSFWELHILSYKATKYDASGRRVGGVRRTPDWFPGMSQWHRGSATIQPPPHLAAASMRGDTMFIVTRLARTDWSKIWEKYYIPGKREYAAGDMPSGHELYVSRLEVIDTRSNQLITTHTMSGLIVEMLTNGRAVVYDETRDGVPRLQIWELRLTNTQSKGEGQ